MKLYSIRNTHTGLFWVNSDWRGKQHWNTSPIFWKTADGVARNLQRLGSLYTPRGGYRPSKLKNWSDFNLERLAHIEVIITDVSILGEKALPAAAFFKTKHAALELANSTKGRDAR